MKIRKATAGDRDFILGLSDRFAGFELPRWRSFEEVAGGTGRRLDDALADTQNERSAILVAEDASGAPSGFAWMLLVEDFYTRRDVAKLSEIAVARDGSGAGAALIAAFESWARERRCTMAILNVMDGNAHARAFYQRHGYASEYACMAKTLDPES